MSGTIITFLPKSVFQRTDTATGGDSIIELGLIDTSQFREGTLLLRLHGGGSIPTSATVTVELRRVAPTPEDPSSFFEDTAAAVLTASLSSSDPNNAPLSKSQTATSALGGFLRPYITLTKSGSTGTFKVTISADLVVKE